MTTVLSVRGLRKSYRRGPEEVHALHGVDFSLAPGEVVVLVGPSGSGKTTLLSLIAGWEEPDAGEILWGEESASAGPQGLPWSDLAIVPQDLGLVEELSVQENIELPLRMDGPRDGRSWERASALADGFGLSDLGDRSPTEVSMGEQQRAALARALVLSPRLLLADEPTGHQDSRWARGVLRAFRMAAEEGTAALVATHNPVALRYADRVLAIRDGRLHEIPADARV